MGSSHPPEAALERGHWPRRPRLPVRLAVAIALVQTLGTTVATRNETPELDLLAYTLLAAGGLALAARRRYPVPALTAVAAATVAYHVLEYPGRGPTIVALIVAMVVAVKAGHRYQVWVVVGAGYAAWVVLTGATLERALVVAAGSAGALLFAEWARVAALHRHRLAEVHAEQKRRHEEQQRRQASEQRLRMAQELHDVLGHHLSLINVQAGVGLHLMDRQPDQARAALDTIKQASAEALAEVRSVLATLHPAGEAAPRTPAPGLGQLDDLTVDAGLPVRTTIQGEAWVLPPELDRAAYRIVQEALTNVRRHAGTGATADLTIEYGERELVVRVEDDGGAAGPVAATAAEGNGIGGMRERASAVSGSLTAGPRPGGGFRVSARLPLPGEDGQ